MSLAVKYFRGTSLLLYVHTCLSTLSTCQNKARRETAALPSSLPPRLAWCILLSREGHGGEAALENGDSGRHLVIGATARGARSESSWREQGPPETRISTDQ